MCPSQVTASTICHQAGVAGLHALLALIWLELLCCRAQDCYPVSVADYELIHVVGKGASATVSLCMCCCSDV